MPRSEIYRVMSEEKKSEYLSKQKEYRNRPEVKSRIKKRVKDWCNKNSVRISENGKVYYAENRDVIRAKHRNYYNKNRNGIFAKKYAKQYGLTLDQWNKLDSKKRREACEICGKKPTGFEIVPGHRVLHIDHNHNTLKFRGLLCFRCNSGLGCFRDSPELLLKASNYIIDRG